MPNSPSSSSSPVKGIIAIIVIVILGVLGYAILTMPDHRNGVQRVGDAIHELPNGTDKAADQLKDRTPAQKLGDAVQDTGNDIKNNTHSQ
jgi:hypothetical protein